MRAVLPYERSQLTNVKQHTEVSANMLEPFARMLLEREVPVPWSQQLSTVSEE